MDFKVALVGFGEAGQSLATAAKWQDQATAFDKKTLGDRFVAGAKLADYAAAGIIDSLTSDEAVSSSLVILSLVTADQALSAAEEAARSIRDGAFYLDGNSVAPQTKAAAAQMIERAGAHYVDMAIMAPVVASGLSVPILVSGALALQAQAALRNLGFDRVDVAGNEVGRASSIKMIRSVIVKGIEALTAECVTAAERAGVLAEVLASLDASSAPATWAERADYNLDRMMVHGLRRAAEMEEVVKTLDALGTGAAMTRGTVERQRAIGSLGTGRPPTGLEAKLSALADAEKVEAA